MSNDAYIDEMQDDIENSEYAEFVHLCLKETYTKWLYENYTIGNSDDLLMLHENTYTWTRYCTDVGLPLSAELGD